MTLDLANWMKELPSHLHEVPMTQLSIPGSHDSGSFYLDSSSSIAPGEAKVINNLARRFPRVTKRIVRNWSITQNLNIYEQLQRGIRYFDFRVAYLESTKQFYVVHGLYGSLYSEVFEEINKFLTEYPKEILILDFNHFYGFTAEQHKDFMDMIAECFQGKLYASKAKGRNEKEGKENNAEEKDATEKDANEKDATGKDATEKDANEKGATEKDSYEKDANDKDPNEKDTSDKDENEKDANVEDGKEEDANEKAANEGDANEKDANEEDGKEKDANEEAANEGDPNEKDANVEDGKEEDANEKAANEGDANEKDANEEDGKEKDVIEKDANENDVNEEDGKEKDANEEAANEGDANEKDANEEEGKEKDVIEEESIEKDANKNDVNEEDGKEKDVNEEDANEKDAIEKDANEKDVTEKDIIEKDGKKIDADFSLNDVWGSGASIIAIYSDDASTKENPLFWPHDNIIISPWSNTDNVDTLINKLNTQLDTVEGCYFHVFQAILNPKKSTIIKHLTGSLKNTLAKSCNKHVNNWLKGLDKERKKKLNIVICDFIEMNEIASCVVALNYEDAGHLASDE